MVYVYLMSLSINTGNRFCADEEYISIRGKQNYLFAETDYDTRFLLAWEVANCKDGHNAENLLKAAAARAGKKPTEFVSDALPSYAQAFESVYAAPNATTSTLHTHIKCRNFQKEQQQCLRKIQRDITCYTTTQTRH